MAEVFKISDIDRLEIFSRRNKSSRPPFFAVFGKPVAHSLSPLMHNAALAEIAKSDSLYESSRYFAFEVEPEELNSAIEKLRAKNFRGINLTIPLKERAMKILSDFDESAKSAKAANTLLKTRSGWKGFNTDGYGILKAVETAFGIKPKGAKIFLIGAGGAARGIAAAFAKKSCAEILISNRTLERAEELSSEIRKNFGIDCKALPLHSEGEIPDGALIINATSVGLKDEDAPVLDFSKVPQSAAFFDTPYRRGKETSSVKASRERGLRAESGLAMLAWQGAKSLQIWTGKKLFGKLMLKEICPVATIVKAFDELKGSYHKAHDDLNHT